MRIYQNIKQRNNKEQTQKKIPHIKLKIQAKQTDKTKIPFPPTQYGFHNVYCEFRLLFVIHHFLLYVSVLLLVTRLIRFSLLFTSVRLFMELSILSMCFSVNL